MSGFLLNMIHRHQGLVDKVQPRIRSIFEPEPAPTAATDNAFANTADTAVKERPDTDFERPSAFTNFKGMEKSSPETAPPEPLPIMFRESVQTNESGKVSGLNPPAENRIGLINEQMQSLLARLAGKPETQEKFSDPHRLQKPASSEATGQTAINIVSNEQGLSSRIEETLKRLTSQASYSKDSQSEFEDHTHLAPAHADQTEADPLARLPRQTGNKAGESGEALHKPTSVPAEPVNAAISSQAGTLQIPAWLTAMQTDVNNRLREIKAKSQAEPVINVTIGRVEVRAINTESAKSGVTSKKPTGVMNLDDYLKQRESKGRT